MPTRPMISLTRGPSRGSRKSWWAPRNSSGFSHCGQWPASAITCSRASGSQSSSIAASSRPPVGSCSVHSSRVGAVDLADPGRIPGEVLAHLGVLQHQRVADRAQEPVPAVDRAAQVDQLVGHHLLVVEQELHPAADGRVARVLHGRQRAVPHPRHHLGLVGDVAGRVQHQPVHPVGMVGGRPGGHPAAERLARQVRAGDAERVHQADQVIGEHVDRVRPVGQVRPAVPDHVVGGDPERRGQPGDVAGVGLQVPAGPVQQDQVGSRPGLQHPGAHPADVHVAERVVDVAELAPDADVMTGIAFIRCPFRTGPGPRRASPARRSAAVRRRAGPAAASSRWSETRPGRRRSRCSAGARSTAACR